MAKIMVNKFIARLGIMGAFIPQNLTFYFKHPQGRKEFNGFLRNINKVPEITFMRMLLYYPFNSIKLVHKSEWVNAPWVTTTIKVKGRRGSTFKYLFDLSQANEIYWSNLQRFIDILRDMGITPVLSIVDFAQTHFAKHRKGSPYALATNNIQNVTMFDEEKFFKLLRVSVLPKIMHLYLQKRFLIELGNEYNFIDNRGDSSVLLKMIAEYLSKNGVPHHDMIVPVGGIDPWHNIAVISEHESGNKLKHRGLIPSIHFGTKEGWDRLRADNGLKWMFNNFWQWMLSTDGARKRDTSPKSEIYWMKKLAKYMEDNKGIFNKNANLYFELQPQVMWGPEKPSFDNIILGHYKIDMLKYKWLKDVVEGSPFMFARRKVVDFRKIQKRLNEAQFGPQLSIIRRLIEWIKGIMGRTV